MSVVIGGLATARGGCSGSSRTWLGLLDEAGGGWAAGGARAGGEMIRRLLHVWLRVPVAEDLWHRTRRYRKDFKW